MKRLYFPEIDQLHKTLMAFCQETNIDFNTNTLTESEVVRLFRKIIGEFLLEKISPDDLSSYCEMVYMKTNPYSQVFTTLLSGADLSWELRNNPMAAAETIQMLIDMFGAKVK